MSKRRSSPRAATAHPPVATGSRTTLSALRPDVRAPGHLVVEVDGARFASLPAERVLSLGLRAGSVLDAQALAQLSAAAAVEAAHQVAIRLLASRPYSRVELARKLTGKGHPRAAIGQVVDRLEASGLVNDSEYARHFARIRLSRGHGPPRIRTDLLAKGVDDRVINDAIAHVLEHEEVNLWDSARSLAAKRARQLGSLPYQTKLRRLVQFLGRRGFRGHEAVDLVKEILGNDPH